MDQRIVKCLGLSVALTRVRKREQGFHIRKLPAQLKALQRKEKKITLKMNRCQEIINTGLESIKYEQTITSIKIKKQWNKYSFEMKGLCLTF